MERRGGPDAIPRGADGIGRHVPERRARPGKQGRGTCADLEK